MDLNQKSNIPNGFICPISQVIMTDPVTDPEGHSYQQSAILQWLSSNKVSPITQKALQQSELSPNRALREAIEAFLQTLPQEEQQQLIQKSQQQQLQIQPIFQQQQKQQPEEFKNELVDSSSNEKQQNCENLSASMDCDNNQILLTITTPDIIERNPVDIVCVIDISGSMEIEATLKDGAGKQEDNGLMVLDIVKHAVNTILTCLGPKDRLAIVSFETKAQDVFQLTIMDDKGKKAAKKAVESLEPKGSTNLWDGLHHGLEMISNQQRKNAIQTVFLLTDGEPNIAPPEGHIPALQKYQDSKNFKCSVNTFGFGYNLDSQLLEMIAKETDGMYSFIPDCSFVGTVFVNTLGNILATYAINTTLSLEIQNGSKFLDNSVDKWGYITKQTSWGREIRIGSIQYGQSKDIAFALDMPKQRQLVLKATLKFEQVINSKKQQQTLDIFCGKSFGDQINIEQHRIRFLMIEKVKEALSLMISQKQQDVQPVLFQLIDQIKSSKANSQKLVKDILQDVEGQITEAFSKEEFFTRWGQHYLPSLLRAHLLQVCNNFKDPGVQNYGGKLFKQVRDEADITFTKLPPPKPLFGQPQQNVDMGNYNYVGYGCFAGSCLVKMGDNSYKKVDQICQNDEVWVRDITNINNNNNEKQIKQFAKVLCVVKTKINEKIAKLIQIQGGLLITNWHPIFIDNQWRFPCQVGKQCTVQCDYVYDFVLDYGHTVTINGVQCATLGHGFTGNVVEHSYFGTQNIIKDLNQNYGWSRGVVELEEDCFIREIQTGLVVGLKQTQM